MFELSGLNPPQRAAVLHGAGPLVVFAGAGSGKTRVITYRIARLVGQERVPAERILAVTFTNKAAAEMRDRLLGLLPGSQRPWIGTFHSICSRLLRRHAELVGVHPNFVIYDDTDQKAMLTRVIRELDLDERRFQPREMARVIEAQKRELIGPEEMGGSGYYADIAQRVYATYEAKMAQSGALDFNDLIYRTVRALREREAFRALLADQWSHILVDEFQDTNLSQLELVRILSERHRNLCVVGDDDQSIYKWRGADRRNILDFKRSFADAEVVKLEQNYRSSGHILAAAMAVISKNTEREPKTLFTENPEGEKLRLITCADERDEARAIREAVRTLRDRHALSDIAIFYRTHAQSRVLEEEMRAANVPYRIIGGQRFYERAEIKDLLAYLRVLVNPQDDVSLLRIVNTPPRGIGKTTLDKVLELAAQRGLSVWEMLRLTVAEGLLPKAASGKLSAFMELMAELSTTAGSRGPAEVADQVLARTGYLAALRAEDSAEADGRIENVQELLASLREFEAEAEAPTLAQYLELVTLQTSADDAESGERLTLMTVHAAKGLEFPVVWVAGLEERLFPLTREDSLSEEDLEEERRLAYVAFTRAEQRLYLSYACGRRLHGDFLLGIPSRFVDEIPEQHLERVTRPLAQGRAFAPSYAPRAASEQGSRYEYEAEVRPFAREQNSDATPASFARSTSARPQFSRGSSRPSQERFMGARPSNRPAARNKESYVDRSEASDSLGVRPGARVRHAKYGTGEVKSVEAGHPPRVTVSFPAWGVKQIVASFLELD